MASEPNGISLRDWFAGQVLMGLATSGKSDYEVAVACHELADEMGSLSDERKRKERKRKERKEANNE